MSNRFGMQILLVFGSIWLTYILFLKIYGCLKHTSLFSYHNGQRRKDFKKKIEKGFCPNFNFSTRNYDRQGNESKWYFFLYFMLSYVVSSVIQFEFVNIFRCETRRNDERRDLNFFWIDFFPQIELFIVQRDENFQLCAEMPR